MSAPTYWCLVYENAAALLREHPEMSGDEAYRLARDIVDAQPLMLRGEE